MTRHNRRVVSDVPICALIMSENHMVSCKKKRTALELHDKTLPCLRIAITQNGTNTNAKVLHARGTYSPYQAVSSLQQNARHANCTVQTFREYKQKAPHRRESGSVTWITVCRPQAICTSTSQHINSGVATNTDERNGFHIDQIAREQSMT